MKARSPQVVVITGASVAMVYGTLAALKRMLPRDRGRISQIGSGLA